MRLLTDVRGFVELWLRFPFFSPQWKHYHKSLKAFNNGGVLDLAELAPPRRQIGGLARLSGSCHIMPGLEASDTVSA
jgi:hypothetical protein